MNKVTYKEDGQLELVIKDDGMYATRPTEPGCDLSHEVSMENEEKDARS